MPASTVCGHHEATSESAVRAWQTLSLIHIWDGDADHGDDLAEYFVRNGIREVLGVDVVGRADAGYADGVAVSYTHLFKGVA